MKCSVELLLKRERPEKQPLILNFSFFGVSYLESITTRNIKWKAPETKIYMLITYYKTLSSCGWPYGHGRRTMDFTVSPSVDAASSTSFQRSHRQITSTFWAPMFLLLKWSDMRTKWVPTGHPRKRSSIEDMMR